MYTRPSMTLRRSPGSPTTRLMKFVSERRPVGVGQAWRCSSYWSVPQVLLSAPAGGLKTTMSFRSGSPKRNVTRSTSTRCPIDSVGTIDSLGILNGLTSRAWIPRARPSATATGALRLGLVRWGPFIRRLGGLVGAWLGGLVALLRGGLVTLFRGGLV